MSNFEQKQVFQNKKKPWDSQLRTNSAHLNLLFDKTCLMSWWVWIEFLQQYRKNIGSFGKAKPTFVSSKVSR